MCGIFCFISKSSSVKFGENLVAECKCLLQKRGPNAYGQSVHESRVLMFGTVLWQQGSKICHQPIENDRFVLLFNGDLFLERENLAVSDTQWLFETITTRTGTEHFSELFRLLRGPYSLVLLDKRLKRVYFGRDSLGRNSLLFGETDEGIFITSVLCNRFSFETTEIVPNGIYYVDLTVNNMPINLVPWNNSIDESSGCVCVIKEQFIVLPWFKKTEYEANFHYHELLKNNNLQKDKIYDYLLHNPIIASLCDVLINILSQSTKERINNTPNYCKQCVCSETLCQHPKVGILFSGGIDCTIIALLADQFVDKLMPIDLLNVSFEKVMRPAQQNANKSKSVSQVTSNGWEVPDRVTGRDTLLELQQLRPHRKWNFVEINVSRKELDSKKKQISNLVYPLKSVLDESLGAALWFASRGKGLLDDVEYQSPCRVLLLGSGADELFAGYSRHRAAFYRDLNAKQSHFSSTEIEAAFVNLSRELDLDWNRLPSRNLARDDRVICDHGITPRTPYLQEDFISVVRSLRASQRCYHPLGAGIGDKLTLRLCGYKLGLTASALLKKRALQFGSRIADRKQNANDNSSFLSS